MNKLLNNNTDLMVLLFALGSFVLTVMQIMDVKDYGALALLVFGYKFAKWQANQVTPPTI